MSAHAEYVSAQYTGAGARMSTAMRLEYLRQQIRKERISYSELSELQSLYGYIEPGDTELLEWAGVPEFSDESEHVTPYTGHPFTDRCDCCGRYNATIIHVPTCGWRYCDRCTDHHSFGTESAV